MGRLFHLHVFLLFLLMVYTSKAQTNDTPSCQDCDDNTECKHNVCYCSGHLTGDPYFQCYHSHSITCRMYSDPVLEDFRGQHVALTALGSFRFAQFRTVSDHGGHCVFTMWAWTERVKGKMYIKGVQVKLMQVNDQQEVLEDEYRVTAYYETSTGVYYWLVEQKLDNAVNFTFIRNVSSEDPSTPFALYNFDCPRQMIRSSSMFLKDYIMCCGIKWGIRPFNPNSTMKIPGIFLFVNQEFFPTFDNWQTGEEPVCLDDGSFTLQNLAQATGLPPKDAISYLSFTNGGLLDYDHAPAIADILTAVLKTCDEANLNRFFKGAAFMWRIPPIVRCISEMKGQDDVMDLVFQASLWFCKGLKTECEESKTILMTRCGEMVNRYTEVSEYMNRTCGTEPTGQEGT